jgi:hypothetical protein
MDSGIWSVIGTNFDPDDETANFGTRHALEADGRLFDVFTYATVDPKVCCDKCFFMPLKMRMSSLKM